MLQKWKFIISNWINCYFNDTKTEECITVNTLLTIISHLHKNLNLDESKSSVLEAQNIEEFILEKYPDFKFGNGTLEPANEEELYVVASLLLFFVCVNSKDVDIKQAMCSRLTSEDQETIMKFSKSLMECSPVTYRDVQGAIIEACGQDIAAGEKGCHRPSVAETPPALRSLHGEVRRLQAALDAERFDRNYLQEELARTNLRMEKLLKDKEQYKLEIVNLKAKISMCCGQEAESRGSEAASEDATRLAKQLEELEERLVDTQEKLDDAQYERDAFKAKIEELKHERDKWLAVSQEETSRAVQLADELDAERRRVQSLQELVSELRQHHQNNRLDASQLECDDPDASIHSLHNASVCSEACANVIEVQLGEERAKVETLKQQIQSLQEKLTELTEKAESEKLALESIITEKDNDISSLKHRINEEMHEKTNLKAHFNDEVSKLNNEINELEQKLKENSENSSAIINQKMQEIQTLHEEKLSLLQSLSDETIKLENIIKDLENNIDTEKNLKVTMREDYENQLMKLNEKVLNRNNELVELQNKVFEKGEMIENLNLDLKKEKALNHELSNKHNHEIAVFNEEKNSLENKLQQKTEEAKELQKRLFQNVAVFDELNREIDDMKSANENLLQNYKILEQRKESLQSEVQQRDKDIEGIRKEIENITNIFSEEKDKFMNNLEERNVIISALQVRLQDEIQYKVGLEKELQHLHQARVQLNEDVMKLNKELAGLKTDISEKDRMIYALELFLKEERHTNLTFKTNNEKLSEDYRKLSEELSAKSSQVKDLEEKIATDNLRFEEELRKKDEVLDTTNNRLLCEMEEKETLQMLLMSVNEEKEIINKDLIDRCDELERLQEDYDRLCNASEQNIKVIEALGNKIDNETKKYLQLEIDFDTHTTNLIAKLNDAEKSVKEITSKSRLKMEDRDLQIQTLKLQIENLETTIDNNSQVLEITFKEKEALIHKLEEEISFKTNIEKEYQNQCAMLDNLSAQLNGEIALKSAEIITLKNELESMMATANEKTEELTALGSKMNQESEAAKQLEYQKNQEIEQLNHKIEELQVLKDDFEQELRKEIASKTQAISALQREYEQLQYTIEEDNSNHEVIIKEKDVIIEELEKHVKILTISLESLRKDYEDGTFTWEKMKIETQDKLEAKNNEIVELKEQIKQLKQRMEQALVDAEEVREENKMKIITIEEKTENINELMKQIEELAAEVTQYEIKIKDLERSNEDLKLEVDKNTTTLKVLEEEKAELLKQNAYLLEELYQEQAASNSILSEKLALAEEQSLLTKQLSEEKCSRDLADQKAQSLLEAKEIIEQQLADKEAAEKDLVLEKELLKTERNQFSLQLKALEAEMETILAEKQDAEQELFKNKEKMATILEEKENLSQQMEVIALVKQAHLSEKVALEQQLIEKDSSLQALLNENKQLLLENEHISQQLTAAETDKEHLLSEIQTIEQQLIEKELSTKALLEEKENLLAEKESLSEHLESGDQTKQNLLAEKQVMIQQFKVTEATLKELSEEKENLTEKLKSMEKEKEALLADKAVKVQQLLENEAERKALLEVKESLQAEMHTLTQKLESLLAENQAFEEQLTQETAKNKIISEEKENLTQELEIKTREIKTLLEEKQDISEKLALEIGVKETVLYEKEQISQKLKKASEEQEILMQQLQEKASVEIEFLNEKEIIEERQAFVQETAKIEKQRLISENLALEVKLRDEKSANNELSKLKEFLVTQVELLEKEKLELLADKDAITQNLKEEIEKISQKLYKEQAERQTLQKQVTEEVTAKNAVLEVKEYLSGQLIDEKSDKELLAQEKERLQEELRSLHRKLVEEIQLRTNLEEETHYILHEKNGLIQQRDQEISELDKLLKEEISITKLLNEEKLSLLREISFLQQETAELKSINEVILHDKELLNDQKEQLIQSLNVEKAFRDEIECEKNAVAVTLQELNDKYAIEMKEKQDEIITVSSELNQVKMDFKKHEDISLSVASVVSGLDKLLQNMDKEKIDNEILQKLINTEHEDIQLSQKCDLLVNIALTLSSELALKRKLERALKDESSAVNELKEMIKEKELEALELQSEVKSLQKTVQDCQNELTKQTTSFNATLDSKVKDIQTLQLENKSLTNELNDVKVQLDSKVHSLKEKLIDNENLTEKLKRTYECQIENLNVMVTKLTSYLKEKTCELDSVRREKEKLQLVFDENNKAIKSLEDEVKTQKANQEKLITDFESERQVMKNMVTVTESIMEDQKAGFNKAINDYEKSLEAYQNEKKILEDLVNTEKKKAEDRIQEKQNAFDAVFRELTELRTKKQDVVKELESKIESLNQKNVSLKDELITLKSAAELLEVQTKVLKKERDQFENELEIEREKMQKEIESLKEEMNKKVAAIESLQEQNEKATAAADKLKDDLLCLQEKDTALKLKKDSFESDLLNRIEKIMKVLSADTSKNDKFKYNLQEKLQAKSTVQEKIKVLTDEVMDLVKEKNEYILKWDETKAESETNKIKYREEIEKWNDENGRLAKIVEDNKVVISNLEQQLNHEVGQFNKLKDSTAHERVTYENRCSLLQEYQIKAENHMQERDKEITSLKNSIENLKEEVTKKDSLLAEIAQVKDEVISTLNSELINEKATREIYQKELEAKTAVVYELKQKLEEVKSEAEAAEAIKKENEELLKAVGGRETFAVTSQEKTSSNRLTEKDLGDRHQVSTPTSDLTHSSMESYKTITDLEKIIHDKNRTITTLQSDITYMKSLTADSENKLLDVTKELEMSKENCEQLSSQLKKLIHQKNEEIADLKKQVSKMSVTENRATQIIKVSAKYQAIILKRIAEIKSNTILKELTNFGNTANCDSELKRNLNSGAITMEDLENFLETTDKHLKRCSDKQVALQKERDRLTEINRINESEIINLKKFLTELSVSFKTFNSIKDLYTQKLSRVVSMQRTVRREILNLDGQASDSIMCKLERGYGAVMQDLCECAMNLERWVERSIARTISSEKIKQAFTSDIDRASLASSTFQNASLEVQLDELENSFQKLLEEVVRAQKGGSGEGARDAQATTVMEVRAEYEDKLNRMKAKMKQLYQDQIQVFKSKQKEEIANLERELHDTRKELAESSRKYEEHIKSLTAELWTLGEKFLMKKDEAEWLRKKQKSGSLMSLQHLHSTGLAANHDQLPSTPSNSHSMQSLPAGQGMLRERKKRDGRGLQMSDEEGEVFDNRWLKELQTPRRESNAGQRSSNAGQPGQRLSELRWRNSLCPPHLKSSYPAETQFANTIDEEEIKCVGAASLGGKSQRKEVGITAYKKPGPPTPSKQAGRLSATDSELRESLRVEPEPAPRKTSTPSRIRAMFRPGKSDTVDLPEKEYPKRVPSKPKCESEYLKNDSMYPKSDCENLKSDSEYTKSDSEYAKSESECTKCDSEYRKNDWFNLNLRQRAARWEPLAKN